MDNKDKTGGWGGWCWLRLVGARGVHKGCDSRGKVPRVHVCLCWCGYSVVYQFLEMCSFKHPLSLLPFLIATFTWLDKRTYKVDF